MDQEAVPATTNKSGLQIEAEKLSQDIQTPSAVWVWIDGAWSGEPVSCKPSFAGAGRLKNDAKETLDYRWRQDREIDENSETCRVAVNDAARDVKGTTEQVPQRCQTRPKTSTMSSSA